MPRQRTHYSRRTYTIPDNFPERLRRFQEESGLSWSEIARRLGTYRHTVGRWWKAGVRPNQHHTKRFWTWPTTLDSATYSPNREQRASEGLGLQALETQRGRVHGCVHGGGPRTSRSRLTRTEVPNVCRHSYLHRTC